MNILVFLALLALVVQAKQKNSTLKTEPKTKKVEVKKFPIIKGGIVLKENNFTQYLQDHENVVVFWYGQDRQSHKFSSEWHQVQTFLNNNDLNSTKIGVVNQNTTSSLVKKQGISKQPAIELYLQKGTQRESYVGHFNLKDICSWLLKLLKNPRMPSKLISSVEQFEEKKNALEVFTIFVGHQQDSIEYKNYVKLAEKRKDIIFLHSFATDVRTFFLQPKDESAIFYYNKFEDMSGLRYINKYKGDLTDIEEIKTFYRTYSTQNVKIIQAQYSNHIQQGTEPNIVLASVLEDFGENKINMEDRLTEVQKSFINLRLKFQNKATLFLLNITETLTTELIRDFQLTNTQPPFLLLLEPGKKVKRFSFKGEQITSNSIVSFYSDFKNGKLKQVRQSENRTDPELQKTLLVKSITYQDWEEIVLNSSVDVVVFFYGIGCYDCNEMKKDYYKLAYRLKNNQNILFTRININSNDIPDIEIKRTPEIWLFKTDRSKVSFIYQKTVESIIQSLKENVSFPWIEPIPNSEVSPSDFQIDNTPSEVKFIKDSKEEQKRQEKKRIQEEKEEKEKKLLELNNSKKEDETLSIEENQVKQDL